MPDVNMKKAVAVLYLPQISVQAVKTSVFPGSLMHVRITALFGYHHLGRKAEPQPSPSQLSKGVYSFQ